jgi:hypothetical protein
MNWDAIGALADMAGAIGVILSLLYLGVQIRNQSKQSRLESVSESTRQWNDILADTANNRELCSIWIRGLEAFDQLDREERAQFSSQLGRVCRVVEGLFEHYQEDRLKPDTWDAISRTLMDFAAYPGFKDWWVTRSHWHSTAFQSHINDLVNIKTDRPRAYGEEQESAA